VYGLADSDPQQFSEGEEELEESALTSGTALWTVSSELLGFLFSFFPYIFVSVPCASSSAFERTLIYGIIYRN